LIELALGPYDNAKLAKELLDKATALGQYFKDGLPLYAQLNLVSRYGRYYFSLGQYDSARVHFEKMSVLAMEMDEAHQNEHLNLAYSYLANLSFETGDYPEALKYDLMSLELEKKQTNQSPGNLIASYNNIGEDYLLIDKPDSALHYYQLGLELAEEIKSPDRKIEVLESLQGFYAKQGDMTKAYNALLERSTIYDTLVQYRNAQKYDELFRKYEAERQEEEIRKQKSQLAYQNTWLTVSMVDFVLVGLIAFLVFRQKN
jgi:tetratricopeptide (TPR) repeat protein